MRTPISFITVFAMTLLGSVFLGIANAASQDIGLVPGWNIVSTSRVVANHAFSATEDFSNFDIYLVNAASVAGWSTMAEVGQSEFTPLYGYFINNKTNMTQILTLNFKDDTTPNERLFERKFTKTGWYSIGVANPTYAVVQNAATADTNNVTSILDSLNGNHSTVIDFTDSDFNTSPSSVRVGDTWKAAVPNDLNSLNDFRETKGYAVYITKEEALYSGFQNTDFQPVILSISPTSVIAGTGEFVLTVNGYNFTPSSTLRWDGADKETTYVSSTQISALILASDVAASTTVKISIFNPAPSGGTSGEFNFTINPTPQLDIALASTPTSTNFVKGATEVGFLGITLRAVNHDIKINSIKVSASTVVGTADELKSDVLNLKLFDGDTQIGATGSLTGTEIPSAIFSSLDYTISSGASKTLIVKADLSSIATTNNKYALKVADVADVSGVDIVAVDPNGNEPTYTGFDEISGPVITVLNAGSMSVATAPDDVDSKAGIVVTDGGATQQVLSKFRFTAANEALTVKKLKLLVNNDSSTAAAATSTAEVTRVYLYDGGSQIGSTSGYSVIGSGAAAGDVVIEDLNWLVAKDATKTLTVKGTV
ncbi:MAG: Cell surface receptor IPT/TIG domain protein, partial [Candidatus Jorgensenbacteria bacterium GW2011_GWA1_48_13]